VAKTATQIEKRKRETENRKKTTNAVLKLAADLPDHPPAKGTRSPTAGTRPTAAPGQAPPGPAVKCLRCDGTGRLTSDCNICSGRGVMAVRCRKCHGIGTYTQEAGPCVRCREKGVLLDGTICPRCKGRKTQMAFTSPCAQCSGSGTFNAPCKKCGGSLRIEIHCSNCNGTGHFQRK